PLSSRHLIHFSCDSDGGFANSVVRLRRPPPCLTREDGGRSPGGWKTARRGGAVVVACAAETARQGRAVAVVVRPSCLTREDGRRSPGRVRRRRLLPRVEVEQQRTGRQGGRVGTLCTSAAFVFHLLQKCALAARAGGGAAVLALAHPYSHDDRVLHKMVSPPAAHPHFLGSRAILADHAAAVTLFGHPCGRLSLAIYEDTRAPPAFLIELPMLAAGLHRGMATGP
uniref:Uncharacterized protein n=2 Tax=Aegilops tauschii subsp. strangulata TaxID=200361 RepID=A0A453J9U0_AEGTS